MSKLPKLNLKDIISQPEPVEPQAAAMPHPEQEEVRAAPPPVVTEAPPPRVVALNTTRRPTKAASKTPSPGRQLEGTKQVAVYLPPAVHDQIRELAFHERAKIHSLILEGLDLLFKKRGLKSIDQLMKDSAE